ncbi:MAG: DNA-binding protein WhiA [Streptococcaceae bacterium]|jgi:DNA-binding protein WhiA|nr:DNA-binding protein WhiA [Streptococcaceae bacterium]
MTFSSDLKKELTSMPATTGALIALVRMNGSLGIGRSLTLSIRTENSAIAQYIYKALGELFEVRAELQVYQKSNLSKNRIYDILIEDNVAELLDELSLADSLMLDSGIPEIIKEDKILQADYLRGAFLSSGSISNIDKPNYQLTIRNVYQEHAQDITEIMKNFGLEAKITEQRGRYLAYLTHAEEIADFITVIGAMTSRLQFENQKIVHEMRGLANRQSNFQSANINKTVEASQQIIKAIQNLADSNELPASYLKLAQLRLDFPEASLLELGQMHDPILSKSAVNHRFRKILELAKGL